MNLNITREIILHGRRDNRAWFEPGMTVSPPQEPGGVPEVFVVAKCLNGMDNGPLCFTRTADLGQTWTPPAISQSWYKIPRENDVFEEPWFVPFHHATTGRMTALGNTHFVQDKGGNPGLKSEHRYPHLPGLKTSMCASLWNPGRGDFEPWKKIATPQGLELGLYYAANKHECEDGSILVPGYYLEGRDKKSPAGHRDITVVRLAFDGTDVHYLEHGSVHAVADEGRLMEPSLVRFEDQYLMTLRHTLGAYVATSKDGLTFGELIRWKFDDGSVLENYNTQQHWLIHQGQLFLVYNRKSSLNNGVVRNRAPLFMAEVDPNQLHLKRETETIVFPENRARMGNFCTANPTPEESWIITGEWVQGMFGDVKPGDRFHAQNRDYNFMQYIGDLKLARLR